MKTWMMGFLCFTCIFGSLSAIGQQTVKPDLNKSPAQRSYHEVKLKIEWTGGSKGKAVSASESVTLCVPLGETSMSNNPVNNGDTYRRAIIRPELQADGRYLVDLTVSETSKDQDYPRMSSTVMLKPGETQLVQTRTSKDGTGDYEFLTRLTLLQN
jgi:hypothetical protein